jgi:hypothetical protein
MYAMARYHNSPVFATVRANPFGLGIARRGMQLRARYVGEGAGCDGRWYALEAGGVVCSTQGFRVRSESQEPVGDEGSPPDLSALLPYRYGRVMTRETYRFDELPSQAELDRLDSGRSLPGLAEKLDGDYFVTIDAEVEHEGRSYVRTVAGKYVPAEHVGPTASTTLHGQLFGEGESLPIAFVIDEDVTRYRVSNDALREDGTADKYHRFEPTSLVTRGGTTCVLGEDGFCIPRESVRIAWSIERPDDVPEGEKWVHVNLTEQTLVAYEGDQPVFATVITSGKEGYDTPTGTYRVGHKYVSIRMSGDDPVEGVYDVDEVPWTMYYFGGYALHGAYWHDGFGRVRSHGCTNIAPADARWLYRWTTPTVPRGWHGRREEGTWVHNTELDEPPLGQLGAAPATESEESGS